MIHVSPGIVSRYPQVQIGCMKMEKITNPEYSAALQTEKRRLEQQLRRQYFNKALRRSHPVTEGYLQYYKAFGKQYHVLMQLDSLVDKGRDIPTRAALVEAMFMAELKNQLLTAAHDAAYLEGSLQVELAEGGEEYYLLAGKQQQLKGNDIFMKDAAGVIGSILYGPDQRTRIRENTTKCIFVVYAPFSVNEGVVLGHFSDLAAYVRLFAPNSIVVDRQIQKAGALDDFLQDRSAADF